MDVSPLVKNTNIHIMRIKISGLLVLLAIVTTTAVAGERTSKFEVKSNCGMCEKTIEKATYNGQPFLLIFRY